MSDKEKRNVFTPPYHVGEPKNGKTTYRTVFDRKGRTVARVRLHCGGGWSNRDECASYADFIAQALSEERAAQRLEERRDENSTPLEAITTGLNNAERQINIMHRALASALARAQGTMHQDWDQLKSDVLEALARADGKTIQDLNRVQSEEHEDAEILRENEEDQP